MQEVQNVLQTAELCPGLLQIPVGLTEPLFLTGGEETQVLPVPPESLQLHQLHLLLLQLPLQATHLLQCLLDSALQLLTLSGESVGMDPRLLQVLTEKAWSGN